MRCWLGDGFEETSARLNMHVGLETVLLGAEGKTEDASRFKSMKPGTSFFYEFTLKTALEEVNEIDLEVVSRNIINVQRCILKNESGRVRKTFCPKQGKFGRWDHVLEFGRRC